MVRKAKAVTKRARRAAEKWRDHMSENIKQYHEMTEFVMGNQWSDEESNMLKTYKKVPLTFPKLGTLANGLIGEQQQNTPQIEVVPMENADEEVAHLRELIVKDLIFSSNSKNTYQVAASQAFIGGFSAYAILTEYSHAKSFDLDIKYTCFKDPTRCYWDISADDINKTDGLHAGWLTRMSREKFRDTYGEKIERKILSDHGDSISASEEEVATVTSTGDYAQYTWNDEDSITIQHHFEKKSVPETLYKLSNGRVLNDAEMDDLVEQSVKKNIEIAEQEQLQEIQKIEQMLQQSQQPSLQAQTGMQQQQPMQQQDPNMPAGQHDPLISQPKPQDQQQIQQQNLITRLNELHEQQPHVDQDRMPLWDEDEQVRIENKKCATKYVVTHYKLAGDYILDQTTFPAEQIPLVFVDQNSYYDKSGKQVFRSFFQDAVDTQRYINYLGTQSAYVLKVSRYDQWIGSKKNVFGQDTQQIWSDPLTQQGMLTFDESPNGHVPREVRPPELSQSLHTQYERAMQDLYTGTGLYPSRLGDQGNEHSGKAINARTRQGSYATYGAFNSINRAITVGGQIVNEMIPHVYDSQRVLALMSPEEGVKNVVVNKQVDEYGEHIENDIRKGTYQVRLVAGPSYEGQKEQALESLHAALQANPQIFNMIADLYAENLPLANTIEIKNRLKALVPPEIIKAGKTGEVPHQQQQQDPAAIQAQAQAQYKRAELQLKEQELKLKQQELELKAKKDHANIQVDLEKIQSEREKIAAELEQHKMEFVAENKRTNAEAEIGHADNLTKIITDSLNK